MSADKSVGTPGAYSSSPTARGTERVAKAVIYARVSSKEQEASGFSVPSQLKLLQEYADSKGLDVVHEFTDAETAGKIGRPQFTEMLRFLARRPDVRYLLCEKTDRLSRNPQDRVTLRELARDGELVIVLVKENIELHKGAHSHAWLVFNIMADLSEHFLDNLSEETRKGLLEKAEQGELPAKAPFGYRNVTEKIGKREHHFIEPHPQEAQIVKRLLELYATGDYPITALRKLAHDAGAVGRRSGRPLTRSEVHRILMNPIYCGEFRWSGRVWPGTHAPIISRELFERVQAMLAERRQRPTGTGRLSFAFSGIFTCGRCGCALTAERHVKRLGRSYVYYACSEARGKCEQPYLHEEQLDAIGEELLRRLQLPAGDLELLRETLHKSSRDEQAYREEQTKALQARFDQLQRRLDQVYDHYVDGLVSREQMVSKIDQWRAEQDDVRRRLEAFKHADRAYVDEAVKFLELAQRAGEAYAVATPEQKRELLACVLSNCTLTGATPCPTYAKPFCWLVGLGEIVKKG